MFKFFELLGPFSFHLLGNFELFFLLFEFEFKHFDDIVLFEFDSFLNLLGFDIGFDLEFFFLDLHLFLFSLHFDLDFFGLFLGLFFDDNFLDFDFCLQLFFDVFNQLLFLFDLFFFGFDLVLIGSLSVLDQSCNILSLYFLLFFLFVIFQFLDLFSLGLEFKLQLSFFLLNLFSSTFFDFLDFGFGKLGLPDRLLLLLFSSDALFFDFCLGLFFDFSLDFIDILILNFFNFLFFLFQLLDKVLLFLMNFCQFRVYLLLF